MRHMRTGHTETGHMKTRIAGKVEDSKEPRLGKSILSVRWFEKGSSNQEGCLTG